MIYFRIMTVYFDKLLSMLCASAHVLAGTLFASHLWLSTCSGSIVVDLHNTSDLNPFYYYVCGFRQPILFCLGCRSTQKMRRYVYFPFLSVCPGQVSFTYIRRTTIKSWHDDEKEKELQPMPPFLSHKKLQRVVIAHWTEQGYKWMVVKVLPDLRWWPGQTTFLILEQIPVVTRRHRWRHGGSGGGFYITANIYYTIRIFAISSSDPSVVGRRPV